MSKKSLFDSIRRKAFERGQEAENLIRQYRILNEEEMNDVMGRLKDATAKLSEEPRMARFTHDASLNHFLTDDQRFKTQFERKRSSGTYNPERREKFENKLFGTEPGKNIDEGAIYGMMNNPEDVNLMKDWGYAYGDNIVNLKPETRYRATFTLGDSLGDRASTAPVPFAEPNMSLLAEPENLEYKMGIYPSDRSRRLELINEGKEVDPFDFEEIPLIDEQEWRRRKFDKGFAHSPLKRDKDKLWEAYIADVKENIYKKLEELENQKVRSRAPYIEYQIFGGVTPADVQSIYTPNKKRLPKAWKETADKYNIEFIGPDGCYYNCKD